MSDTHRCSRQLRVPWPALRVDEWPNTRDILHMWTQIIGKLRATETPMINYWWNVTFYVPPRGSTISAIPHGGRLYDVEFDFCTHRLLITLQRRPGAAVALAPKPVAEFYAEVMAALRGLDLEVPGWTMPSR